MFKRILNSVVGFALIIAASGCSAGTEPEPTVMGTELLELVDPLTFGDGAELGAIGLGRFARIAEHCDSSPERSETDACGRAVLSDAHFEWSGCEVELPEEVSLAEVVVSGTLDVTSDSSGSCDDGSFSMSRELSLELSRELPNGVVMHLTGAATAVRTAGHEPMVIELSVAREIVNDGTVVGGGHLTGAITVITDPDTEGRTLSGELTMEVRHPRAGEQEAVLVLHDLVRLPFAECRWPVGGSVERTGGDKSQLLTFGPQCGQATLDGEPVDLEELARHAGGRGGRGSGRPF